MSDTHRQEGMTNSAKGTSRCPVTLSPCRPVTLSWITGFVLCLAAKSAGAEEVRWRYDYSDARQEARQTGRPLLLDFSTEWCTHCKKLDVTTFRDPTVARTLNEQFIPVKLDGTREKRIVEALRIQAYPTIVLADADGKILKSVEGYLDARCFHDQLQGALAAIANPDWMNRAYQDATRAAASSQPARAVALLKTVLEDRQNRPLQQQARRLLEEIEQQARTQLARARRLEDEGKHLQAMDSLSSVMQNFAGTQAADEAASALTALADKAEVHNQQRQQRAAELLAQVKGDLRTHQFYTCFDRCILLAHNYGDLPEGVEGAKLLEQMKGSPDWMKAACTALSERLGEMHLALAESHLQKGERQQATQCLEQIATTWPGSRHAELARTRLAQIQGRTTAQPVNLQKR